MEHAIPRWMKCEVRLQTWRKMICANTFSRKLGNTHGWDHDFSYNRSDSRSRVRIHSYSTVFLPDLDACATLHQTV